LKSGQEYAPITENPGHMYQVNIAADPAHMLDWDKPVGQQSEALQQGMRNIDNPMLRTWQNNGAWNDVSGKTIYNELVGKGGMTFGNQGAGRFGQASQQLNNLGIPGIKYLDQGSRGAGTGSSNYVVFNPQIVSILRKYGILAPLAAGAMGGLASQDQYQQ
jgi:hypothetical protein